MEAPMASMPPDCTASGLGECADAAQGAGADGRRARVGIGAIEQERASAGLGQAAPHTAVEQGLGDINGFAAGINRRPGQHIRRGEAPHEIKPGSGTRPENAAVEVERAAATPVLHVVGDQRAAVIEVQGAQALIPTNRDTNASGVGLGDDDARVSDGQRAGALFADNQPVAGADLVKKTAGNNQQASGRRVHGAAPDGNPATGVVGPAALQPGAHAVG